MAPAMPCKIMKICGCGESNKVKTRLACILEADESTRPRKEIQYQSIINTILQEKERINSSQHYNLVHKFIPMPQAMKIPAAKAAVDKEWEKLKRFLRGT